MKRLSDRIIYKEKVRSSVCVVTMTDCTKLNTQVCKLKKQKMTQDKDRLMFCLKKHKKVDHYLVVTRGGRYAYSTFAYTTKCKVNYVMMKIDQQGHITSYSLKNYIYLQTPVNIIYTKLSRSFIFHVITFTTVSLIFKYHQLEEAMFPKYFLGFCIIPQSQFILLPKVS